MLDLFTGTTRVARELKRRGMHVTAVDTATYSKVLADAYVATDATTIETSEMESAIDELNRLPGQPGYFAETYCVRSRFFQPHNGARVDAIRERIEREYSGTALYPILMVALMLAADRVDSTTGLQMAYLKTWAPRSFQDMWLRCPELVAGTGTAVLGDALEVAPALGHFDLAYLDPPYNQHRYFTNYHIWETLVRWDSPEHYGVACKRVDSRAPETRSKFNSKRTMPAALRTAIRNTDAKTLVVSYNNESWVTADDLLSWCLESRETATLLEFDSKRYVGATIGIHDPEGRKVGTVGRLRNVEYVIVAGSRARVKAAVESVNHGSNAK